MDYDGAKHVNDMAFGQSAEGLLVEKLRMNSEFLPRLSIAAELNDKIVSSIFFPVLAVKNFSMNWSIEV